MVLPDKVYKVLKWLLTVVVNPLIALIGGLSIVYGWDTDALVTTIALFATFLGAIFGISYINYKKANTTDEQ